MYCIMNKVNKIQMYVTDHIQILIYEIVTKVVSTKI